MTQDLSNNETPKKKNKAIQNGDFRDIQRILSNFEFDTVEIKGRANYFDIVHQDRIMITDHDLIKHKIKPNDNFIFSLMNKQEDQFIELKIANFLDVDSEVECYYFPIFKNVIFELEDGKYVAIHFIVLDFVKSKQKSVITIYKENKNEKAINAC